MNKTIAAATAMALLASISATACSGSGGKKSLELIVGTANDDFYVTMECGAKQEAAKLGVDLKTTGPSDFTVPLQKPIIDAAQATKPDALLVAPTDASALNPDLKTIQSNGTKVVLVDTTSSDQSIGVSRISSDNPAGGATAADNLAQQIGGKGTVAVLSVNPGVSTTDQRVQGFENEMKAKYPNVKVLAPQYDNDSASTAATIIGADIQKNPDLSGVFAANVLTAQGVATGVKSAGKQGKVKVATFDADPQQMQALTAGVIQLAIAQAPAAIGKDAVDQAVNALDKKPVAKTIGTPLVAITQQNMNDPKVKPYVYVGSCGG